MLEKAGYPDGEGLPELRVGFNSGVGHEDVFALIQADLKVIGINTKLEGVDGPSGWDQMDAKDFQLGRLGWSSDYPIMDNWIAPLFQTAASTTTPSTQTRPSTRASLTLGPSLIPPPGSRSTRRWTRPSAKTAPVAPVVFYAHQHVSAPTASATSSTARWVYVDLRSLLRSRAS